MANLFELMSDTQRSCEAEIKKCSVILRRTCAIRESVDRASAEHTEAVGTEKGVSTSREFSVTSQWNNLRLDDARTRSDPMEHIGANSEELTWTEGPQRVSSFTIPKKRRENKDLLVDLPLTSRECQKEVLPTLVESYQHPSSQGAFSYTEVKSVNNKGLLNKFLEKRRELRQMGYSDKELLDSYAFLYARTAKEVETICRNGVHVGNSCVSCLGHPEMGVQLCRYSDVLKQEPFQYSQTGHIIIFKVMKGKIKTVTENRSSVYLEPTPNYDCHISKSILTESTTVSPGREYESTQIYLYEYGDLEVLPCPRHICPVFVAKFTYIRRELKHSSKYMYVTPSTRSAICHSASSRMSGSQVQTTTTTTSISSLPSPCGPTISSGIPSSCISTWTPQPATTKGDENGTVVWNGKLCLMGDLHCLVDLVSRSSNLKPAHLGTAIDIRMRMKRDTARAKFLSQVKSLRRNADVFSNSQYYSVCHLKPTADNFISRFQAVVKYLCKMDSVGVLHDGAMNLLLIMPAGKLTEELGLFQDGDANLQLCCVFISPKPRRQVLRNIRAERSIGHLQASENIAVTQDLPPAQMIRHLVSWCPGEEKGTKVQNLSLPDYDRGFQTTFPQNSLISRPLLHDLFVEQILIQRQHNSVTGVLHVPSKLYGEKSNIGSVVKPKMNTPKVCMPEVTAGVWNKKTVLSEEEASKQKVCDSGSIVCIDFNGPSCEMSPTMISPDTTFPDHDPKVNPLGTLKVIEHTLEDTVSSTVSDLNTSVSPDTLTDELAEQIVRGYRPSSHRVNSDHKKVNLRDPRKRKLLETLTKVASGQHSAMETDTAKKSCYIQGHVELNSKKDTLLPVTSSVSAMENTPSVSDTDLASFSPEPSDGKQENSAYEINIVKKISSEQLVQKTSLASDQTQKRQVEPDIVITALGMKQLLDSDLEDPSLKVNDGSEDEFEEPTPEEISDALDRRLLMDSLKQSIKSSKTSGPVMITPGLRVTIKKKDDSSVISSATDMKSFLNLNVSCVDSVETPTGLREVPGGIAKAVSAAQDQSKPPLFVQGTPIKPKRDTVNIIRTEDSPVGVLRDESKLKASAKSPVLWKDKTFCLELLKKPTPKEIIQEDCLQANKQSPYTSNLSKNDAHGLSDSTGEELNMGTCMMHLSKKLSHLNLASQEVCQVPGEGQWFTPGTPPENLTDFLISSLETCGVKGAAALFKKGSDEATQKNSQYCYLCIPLPQRPPISHLFPGSSCSKTIPAGFFSDAQCLITMPKSSGRAVFEEDVVISDLAGNLKANDLLVFLTNVAQKYNHFVGDYLKQAGLDEILLDSGRITPRKISVGILYPDMTVTVPNGSQGEDDLKVCVFEVLHGRNSIPPLDDKKMGVSDFVNSVIHTRGLPDTSDRYIELTEKISLENVGSQKDKSCKEKCDVDIAPCIEHGRSKPVIKACDGVAPQISKKETLLTKLTFLSGTTDRECAETPGETIHGSLGPSLSTGANQSSSITSSRSSDLYTCPDGMTPASSGRDTQAPEVHFQAEENVQLEISSVNRSKLSLQTYNSETGAPNRCLAVIKEESIGGLQPKRCSPSHCVEEMCPLVNVTDSTDISYKHSGECIYSKSTGGTDRFQSFECIPRNEPKSSLKEIAKLTTTVVSTSNHSPVSEECAEEHHLVCQELQSPKTRKPHQMKPSDVQKPNSHEGITIPVKVSSTRKCDEQTSSNTHMSRQHPDMSMEKTFGEKPNNVHVSDIVSTSSYSGKCVASHIRNTQAEGCRNLNKTEITIPAKSLSGRPAKNSMARHNFLFKFWKKLSNEKETIVDKSISNKWSDKPNSGSLKQQNPSISSTLSKVKPVVKFKRTFQTVKPEIVTDNDSNSKEGLSKPFRTVEIRPGSFLPPKIQFSQFDTKSNLVSEKEPSIYQNYDQVSLPDCLSVDTNSEAQDQNKKRKSSLSAETHQIQPDCLLQSDLNWCPGYKKQRSSGEESSVPGLKQTCFSDSAEDLAMDSCSDYIPNRGGHSHLLSNCDSWHSVGDTCGSLSTLPQDDGVVVHGKDLLNNKPLSKSEPDVKNSGSEEDSAPMLENRGSELYDPFDLDDRSLSPSPPGCSADPDSNMTSCKTPWIPTPKSVTEVKEEIAPKLDFLFTVGLNYNSTKLPNYPGSPQTKSDSVYEDARTLKENNRDSVDLGQISSLLHKDLNDEKHRMVREINVFNYRPGNMHTAPYCATRVADPVLSQEEKKNRESKGSHVKSKRTSRWGKPLFEDPVPLNLKEGTKKKPSTLCVKRLKKVDPVGKSTDTSWSVSTRASNETCCTAISIKTHPESVMLSNKDVVLTHGDMTNLYLDEVKASSREMKATATVEVLCDKYSSVSSQKFPSSDYDRRAVLSNPVTLNSLSGKRTVSSTKVVQLRGKVFKTPTRTACLLPASVSSSSGILPAAGGILIPDDSVYLESSPDNLERILNHLKKQQERGCDLTVKVHSQQICKLATKRRIFKEGSSANAQASGVLRLLTQFIKEGVVDLLQQHSCDSSQFLSAEESVACACDLHKKHCSVDQATVLLSKSGDDKLQQMGHEYGLRTATIGELLGICGD